MSIASRIEAIEEHLTDDYSVLTLAGADLTSVNKNILNLKPTWKERLLYFMNNGTQVVWNNWNKVSGTGTSLTLNNTEEAPMSLTYKGNTSQTGTPTPSSPIPVQVVSGDNSINVCGKNLFDYSSASDTNNTISGTYRLYEIKGLIPNEYYYLSGTTFNSALAGKYVYLWSTTTYPGNPSYLLVNPSEYHNEKLFISNNEGKIYLAIYPVDTTTWSSVIEYFKNAQIEKGSTATTYEAYKGESYPISLGVENLYNSINRLQTRASLTCSIINNRVCINGSASNVSQGSTYFHIVGTEDTNANYYDFDTRTSGITLKAGTYRITTTNITGSYETTGNINIRLSYNTTSTPHPTLATITMNTGNTTTFTLVEDTTVKIDLQVYVPSGTTVTMNNFSFDVELIKGSTQQKATYTPIELCKIGTYQDKIDKSTGKNLFDISTIVKGRLDNGVIGYGSNTTALEITNATISFTTNANWRGVACDYIMVTPSTQYTISQNTSASGGIYVDYYRNDKTFIKQTNNNLSNSKYVITTDENTYFIRFCYELSTATSATISNIQVEKGNIATPVYEPYGKVWYKYSAIGKVTFNGSENWAKGSVFYLYSAFSSPALVWTDCCKSKYFAWKNNASTNNSIFVPGTSGQSSTTIWLKYDEKETANDLKTWLSENNLDVYYILSTPTYETITDTTLLSQLEAIKSVEGQTNISQINNDLPFELDVTALEVMN